MGDLSAGRVRLIVLGKARGSMPAARQPYSPWTGAHDTPDGGLKGVAESARMGIAAQLMQDGKCK